MHSQGCITRKRLAGHTREPPTAHHTGPGGVHGSHAWYDARGLFAQCLVQGTLFPGTVFTAFMLQAGLQGLCIPAVTAPCRSGAGVAA